MKISHINLTLSLLAVAVFAGCSQSTVSPTASPEGAAILIDAEPAGAKAVGDVHKESRDGDEVVMIGRIGGSQKPFVDGLAAFTVVDPTIPHCADDEGCPTPWDYCCTQDKLVGNQATVKIVDDSGQPLQQQASDLLGVKELALVVVKGKAQRDDAGNLSVTASEVFVKERK